MDLKKRGWRVNLNSLSLLELAACVCEVVDLVSDVIKDHHNRVACGAYQLTRVLGIKGDAQRDIVIAAALHDVGGLTVSDRLTAVDLDFEDSNDHAEKGYRLLRDFALFEEVAHMVRYHHTPWDHGNAKDHDGNTIPIGSQIILLADRISVLLQPGPELLKHTPEVLKGMIALEGDIYCSEVIDALKQLSTKDSFWLDIVTQNFFDYIYDRLSDNDIILYGPDLDEAAELLCNMMDFRSVFTASHSKGVSVIAETLAKKLGLSDSQATDLKIAGLLHDIGKLAVPTEIIEKRGPLTAREKNIIRCHPYYTDKILSHLNGLSKLRKWASHHHESLNGKGYPFGLEEEDLSFGANIIKVADVFVALTENRPYRDGMGLKETLTTMQEMMEREELVPEVFRCLATNVQELEDLFHQTSAEQLRRRMEITGGLS